MYGVFFRTILIHLLGFGSVSSLAPSCSGCGCCGVGAGINKPREHATSNMPATMPVKIRTPLEKPYFRKSLSRIGGKISPPAIGLEATLQRVQTKSYRCRHLTKPFPWPGGACWGTTEKCKPSWLKQEAPLNRKRTAMVLWRPYMKKQDMPTLVRKPWVSHIIPNLCLSSFSWSMKLREKSPTTIKTNPTAKT